MELETLWRQYRDLPCDTTRNALIIAYMPLVAGNAARLYATLHRGVDLDDLKQAGAMGLLQAIDAYNPARGHFPTFAWTRVRGSMLDWIRSTDWLPRRQRERCEREGRELSRLSIEDIALADPRAPDPAYEALRKDLFDHFTQHLTRAEKLLVNLHCKESLSMDEIGRALGLGPSRVFQIKKNLLRRLLAWMVERGIDFA